MKIPLSIAAVLLLIEVSAIPCAAQLPGAERDRLIGAWKLVALEQPGADGKLNTIDCCGMFVFTRDGHLSVQVMERGAKLKTTPAGPEQYSQGGYEASYGSYVVDERAHTFAFHVDGALVRALIGKDLLRVYELRGNRLIVRSARSDEHWRVIWQRY